MLDLYSNHHYIWLMQVSSDTDIDYSNMVLDPNPVLVVLGGSDDPL